MKTKQGGNNLAGNERLEEIIDQIYKAAFLIS